MRRLAAVLLCAALLLLSGCSLNLPQTGKGDLDDSSGGEFIVGINNGINDPSTEQGVIYDRCGVKIRLAEIQNMVARFTYENTTDQLLRLYDLYTAADGTVMSDMSLTGIELKPNSGVQELTTLKISGISTFRIKLYLCSEDYVTIEDSIAEPVEITFSDKLRLPSKRLYTLIYDDSNVKLGLQGVSYKEDSQVVTLDLYLENKTDKDLVCYTLGAECVHEDYYASFNCAVPAKGRNDCRMRASTSNNTIFPSDLDSITFKLVGVEADNYLRLGKDTLFLAEDLTILLPKAGRPSYEIPDTIETKMTPAEYLRSATNDGDLPYLPALKNSTDTLIFDDGQVYLEYIGGYQEPLDDGLNDYYFCFLCRNQLKKRIKLEPYGILNGGTADFYGNYGIAPMTEEYFAVSGDSFDPGLFKQLSDVHLRFDVRYDDGKYDGSSFITSTEVFNMLFGDEPYRPGVPEGAKLLCSDDSCDIYLLKQDYSESMERLRFYLYAVNKTDNFFRITAEAPSIEGSSVTGSVGIYSGTTGTGSIYLRNPEGHLSESDAEGLTLKFTVSDANGDPVTALEGTL